MNSQTAPEQHAATLPDLIEKLLQQQGIAYQLRPTSDSWPAAQQVQASLLCDAVGTVLTLIPKDHLLDLKVLGALLGRELEPVRDQQLQRILSKHQLNQLPGLPILFNSPCVCEQSLLEHSEVCLDSGLTGWSLVISQDGARTLMGKASLARFAVPMAGLSMVSSGIEQDGRDFSDAVQNFTALRMKQRLEETIEIPPLPESAQKIMKLRVDPDADIADLADVVETDPSLAAQVVSWPPPPTTPPPAKSARWKTPSAGYWALIWSSTWLSDWRWAKPSVYRAMPRSAARLTGSRPSTPPP